MKNLYFTTMLFFSVFILNAQIVNIPDANFKNALVNTNCVDTDGDGDGDIDADTNDDGEIQESEAEAITGLDIGKASNTPEEDKINSIEGIQNFINITSFRCFNNLITELNLLQDLNIEYLICTENQLTSIDVSIYPNLIRLSCGENFLSNIDVSQNPNLTWLGCGGNFLTSLDVTQNPNLDFLIFWRNQISTIDLSHNPELRIIQCYENSLTNLDVSNNPILERLECGANQLSSIDVTQNPELWELFCYENNLTSLDLSQNYNLLYLNCVSNQLTELDVSQNTSLNGLYCNDNLLTSLNIKNSINYSFYAMNAQNNPNLNCITVDDVDYANNQDCNNDHWCKDNWANYSEDCVLGIIDFNFYNVKIYPNPVKNILNINAEFPIDQIKIYTLQGKLLQKTRYDKIDVSLLSTGIYFISVIIDGENIIKKFIKD